MVDVQMGVRVGRNNKNESGVAGFFLEVMRFASSGWRNKTLAGLIAQYDEDNTTLV